jgi:succinate-acetate transporter protein
MTEELLSKKECLKLIRHHKIYAIICVLLFLIKWGIFLPLILIGWFHEEILGFIILTFPIMSFMLLDMARIEYNTYKTEIRRINVFCL